MTVIPKISLADCARARPVTCSSKANHSSCNEDNVIINNTVETTMKDSRGKVCQFITEKS